VRWIYGGTPSPADLPVLKGLQAGWFAETGVKVVTTAGGQIDQLESVGTGNHDITVGSGVELLVNREEGLPVEAVGVVQPLALNSLFCRPGLGITAGQPKTLQGHQLATADTSDTDDTAWRLWRDEKGLTGKVNEVSKGVVDCFPDLVTFSGPEREFGQPPVQFRYGRDLGLIGQVLDVNTDFATQHPQAVRAFVEVYARGMQWAAQHPDEGAALLQKTFPEIDAKVAAVELEALAGYWVGGYQKNHGYLAMNDASWKATAQVLTASGRLKKMPDLATVYRTDFLPRQPYRP
jgi:NitT/TauT family transport system substrate-binding protein